MLMSCVFFLKPIFTLFFQIFGAAHTLFKGGKNSKVKIGGWERSQRILTLFTSGKVKCLGPLGLQKSCSLKFLTFLFSALNKDFLQLKRFFFCDHLRWMKCFIFNLTWSNTTLPMRSILVYANNLSPFGYSYVLIWLFYIIKSC